MAAPALADGSLSVVLYFVDADGVQIDGAYQACGDTSTAGPFMSADSAVDWKNSFLPNGTVFSRQSTDDGVCQGPALIYDQDNGWHR